MDKRLCDNCGKYMTRGYVIENGMEYYCSEECLYKRYTPKEYRELYDDGDGDSYYTEWEDEIEEEIEFLKSKLNDKGDFFGFRKAIKEYNLSELEFDNILSSALEYCLYDGYFNPYYDKEYIDCMWVKNKDTGLIYNLDDMYEIFIENIKGRVSDK